MSEGAGTPARARLDGFDDATTSRLLGMIVALGGEVFVLKAQVERLTRALEAAGVIDAAALDVAGNDPALSAWIGREDKAFGEALLGPFLEPDAVKDVTAFLRDANAAASGCGSGD